MPSISDHCVASIHVGPFFATSTTSAFTSVSGPAAGCRDAVAVLPVCWKRPDVVASTSGLRRWPQQLIVDRTRNHFGPEEWHEMATDVEGQGQSNSDVEGGDRSAVSNGRGQYQTEIGTEERMKPGFGPRERGFDEE